MRAIYSVISGAAFAIATAVGAQAPDEPTSVRNDIRFYRIAAGFQPEVMDEAGTASGTGFAKPNRWGQYTAYLMHVTSAGERTWRIEHYLPYPGQGWAQGSTMYLIEGHDRALLIDTANPATYTLGKNDLKTVVRQLLSHDDKGGPIRNPLDFVVANTHNHGDHIGENRLMGDRTVYYMDGDWPAVAPANYVPVREGGGATEHGSGKAIGEIDLGGRTLKVVDVPPHTHGSVAYLDAANRLLFSGDALGSAWPWMQFAPLSVYAETLRRLNLSTRAFPDLVVLPAHFYQVRSWGRAGPPLRGRPLDRRYIADQLALADGLLAGTIVGTPYPWQHSAFWAQHGSARAVFSLYNMGLPGEALPTNYHAASISGGFPREWTLTTPPPAQDINRLSDVAAKVYLVRQKDGPTLYLVRGSSSALLIGTGTGAPGLATVVARLADGRPLDVVVMDEGAEQTGGLRQLKPRTVYGPGGQFGLKLADGAILDLGKDAAGRPLLLEAQGLSVGTTRSLTLRLLSDRLMFTGGVLGRRSVATELRSGGIAPFEILDPVGYQVGLTRWSARTMGRYDSLLGSGSADWYLGSEYVTQLEQTLTKANLDRGDAVSEPGPSSNKRLLRSSGATDIRALISVAATR